MGLGYTAAITVTAAVRELLGTGKIWQPQTAAAELRSSDRGILPRIYSYCLRERFFTLAFLVAIFQKLISVSAEKKEKKAYLTENCAEENAEAETEESDD